MKKKTLICMCFLLFLSVSFGKNITIINAQSFDEMNTIARDAAQKLDEILNGNSSGTGTDRNAVHAQTTNGGSEPRWVSNPYTVYARDRYIAAVGAATDRVEAEKQALAALTAVFEISIQSDYYTATVYSEMIQKGIVTVSGNTLIRDTIITAASLDKLIGAEIGNVWENDRGTVFALAFVEKEKTIAVYTEIIRINLENIKNITAMNTAQKNTFDGYARYKLAALISGINAKYANIIVLAGGSTALLNLTSAEVLNFEASNILKNIAVSINIEGDRNNRIRYTFAKILSNEGLQTQENNSPYKLKVMLNLSEVTIPNNNNKFCQYSISANLIEENSGLVLLPFNLTDRVAHLTYEEAENRAIATMEKIIGEQYTEALKKCLSTLLPQK